MTDAPGPLFGIWWSWVRPLPWETSKAPCLIVELLSASTRAVDKSFKASDDRRLDSLQGGLLVNSEARGVAFHRCRSTEWGLDVIDTSVERPCLAVSLSVEDRHRHVGR